MIGATLKRILEEKKMTPMDLSKLTDIPVQTIYSLIKRDNDKVGLKNLVKICKHRGILYGLYKFKVC